MNHDFDVEVQPAFDALREDIAEIRNVSARHYPFADPMQIDVVLLLQVVKIILGPRIDRPRRA